MAEGGEKKVLSLKVNRSQRDAIAALFAENNWDFEEVQLQNVESIDEGQDGEFVRSFRIRQSDMAEECPYCLCQPCITDESNRQMWWPTDNSLPSLRNHSLRKELYKKFWTMLFHRGVFLDPRYQDKKLRALRQDPQCRNLVMHRRDLLPLCVLKLVRTWLPNPKGVPYMGHKWE
ncbi:hypothetical protein FSP39_016352 [Pinctada imbricata]|uniref:Uncharacterized protein n=1 Tax=Pinctada imbricata TaxID=66713 RepID=A0AA89CAY4_PINIB|nr:hypothetical protein FSP39_016352 [Pinctada imbricata]